jgi:transcriptional regulator with XRE-family HTH domain
MTKKRKRTDLGRELAKLRIDFDQNANEMSENLGISSSSLFNYEHGAQNIPYEFIVTVKEKYGRDLTELYAKGGGLSRITLELDELSPEDRELAMTLWRKANKLDIPEQPASEPEPVFETKAAPAPKPSTPALPDDVGFISETELDELEEFMDL